MADFVATFVPLLGQALLHFVWQGALIGGLAALLLAALREARPQARYAVACLALLACVLAPLATLLAPLVMAWFTPGVAVMPIAGEFAASTTTATVGLLQLTAASTRRFEAYLPAIVATWAVGTGLMSLRMVFGLAWVHHLRQSPQGPLQLTWQARLDALAAHFQLRRSVELRLVDNLDTPVAAGWWKPVVLLPAALIARMPVDLLEALLAHELAHIRRHDYLVNLLQNAVEALLFYHPVTWWLSHRIRVERELVADQLAAEVVCAPRRLALALSELSELQRTPPALHLLQAAHGGPLMSRIEQLLRPTRRTHPVARVVFPLLGLVAFAIASYTYAGIAAPAAAVAGSDDDVTVVKVEKDERVRNVEKADKAVVVRKSGGTTVHGSFHVDDFLRDGYALVDKRGDDINSKGNIDTSAVTTFKRLADGEFLWFRRDGHDFVVTDPGVLARARDAWRETDALGRKMEPLGAQMEVHGAKMEMLGAQMEVLSEDREPTGRMLAAQREMKAIGRQQRDLGREQSALADQMDDAVDDSAKQDALGRRMDALGKKMDALARLMDAQARIMDDEAGKMDEMRKPMDALAREMDQAARPMDVLGRQMDVIGRQLDVAAKKAERETRELIDEAMSRNLARPVASR
ncbi:MAG: M56 family metallopeptidase [Arenimonas sp.]